MAITKGVLLAGALIVGLQATGCKRNRAVETDAPQETAADASASLDAAPQGVAAIAAPKSRRAHLRASIEGLGDVFAALAALGERIDPETPWDARSHIQAQLLTSGFGPAFLENIDLAGLHVVTAAIPTDDDESGASDVDIAGSIAVIDGRIVLESMPASSRPQPLGGGLWELNLPDENRRLLLREQARSIDFSFDASGLDQAAGLRAEVGAGNRIRLRAWGLPVDDFDLGNWLGSGAPPDLVRRLDDIGRDLEAVSVELDAGTQRDFVAVGTLEAPFHRLGLDMLGEPRALPSRLEAMLPGNPDAVITLSLGDLAPASRVLREEVPLGEIPDPFGPLARDALSHTTAFIDQIGSESVWALYFSSKGDAALLMAAAVDDEPAARTAARGLVETIYAALDAQRKLVGQSPGAKFEVGRKIDGLSVSGAKADHLWMTVPKDMQEDVKPAAMFVARNRFEAFVAVRDSVAVATFGAGAQATMTTFLRGSKKPPKPSLGDDAGLVQIRAAMGGCQLCASGDPVELLRLRLAMLRGTTKDRSALREIRKATASLVKMRLDGKSSLGARIDEKSASLASVLPQTLLFAPAPEIRRLFEISALIERDGLLQSESSR
jgi:hypothetical protein